MQISKDMGKDTSFISRYKKANEDLKNGYIESIIEDFDHIGKYRDFCILENTGQVIYKNVDIGAINEYFSSSISTILKIHEYDPDFIIEYKKLLIDLDDFYIRKQNEKNRKK